MGTTVLAIPTPIQNAPKRALYASVLGAWILTSKSLRVPCALVGGIRLA